MKKAALTQCSILDYYEDLLGSWRRKVHCLQGAASPLLYCLQQERVEIGNFEASRRKNFGQPQVWRGLHML